MTSLRQKLFTTVIVFTVVFAQVFGLQRGYACDHYGNVVETEAEHCHEAPADSGEQHVPCDMPCDSNEPKEEHAPVVVELTARSSAPSVSVPEFVAVQVFEMLALEWSVTLAAAELEAADRFVLLAEGQKPPTAALAVVRSVVLLV